MLSDRHTRYDLAIIGGGINGCGIARDAAGRGLKVILFEKDDLASHTSSWSSKLIHGGLRYLEQYEFRLVRAALKEREVLLRIAPHLTRPLAFVLPHHPSMRPRWLLRAGLFLYDHLGGKISLPKSRGVRLPAGEVGAGLKPDYRHGFIYSDAQVDDARLTVATAMSAAAKGARILTRTACTRAVPASVADGGGWLIEAKGAGAGSTGSKSVHAKVLVNAAGPWVQQVLDQVLDPSVASTRSATVRLVKGSHIVVPKLYQGEFAYILQNTDQRVVFVIPWLGDYSLIGTTDVPVTSMDDAETASEPEIDYLLSAVNQYFARRVNRSQVIHTFAGVRPLYDDGESNASEVTRDFVLRLDQPNTNAPVLHIFGGKITTYRELAEEALQRLSPYFLDMSGDWSHTEPLPGGDFTDSHATLANLTLRYSQLPTQYIEGLFKRHGTCCANVLGASINIDDLGEHFGADLYSREVDYLIEKEWALRASDILWRRTKCGLKMNEAEQGSLARYLMAKAATRSTAFQAIVAATQ